jgi:hypothetical protein
MKNARKATLEARHVLDEEAAAFIARNSIDPAKLANVLTLRGEHPAETRHGVIPLLAIVQRTSRTTDGNSGLFVRHQSTAALTGPVPFVVGEQPPKPHRPASNPPRLGIVDQEEARMQIQNASRS